MPETEEIAEEEVEVDPDPWRQKYHPLQLPANPLVAASFPPELLDESVAELSDEQIQAASNAIAAASYEGAPEHPGASLMVEPVSVEDALEAQAESLQEAEEAAAEEETPEEEPAEEGYEGYTVAELKEELEARGLHTSGNKPELIERLEEDDSSAS